MRSLPMIRHSCLTLVISLSGLLLASPSSAHPAAHQQIDRLSHLIERHPGDSALYARRGKIHSEAGQLDAALRDFSKAADLEDPELFNHEVGVVYFRKGDFATAIRYFDQHLTKFPDTPATYEYRARAWRERGDFNAALNDLRHYLTLQARPNPGHYSAAADLLLHTGKASIQAAIDILDQGMERLGLVPTLQRKAIELELQRGKQQKAIERMQALASVLGEGPKWQLDIARLYVQSNQTERAIQHIEQAERQLQTLRPTPARIALSNSAKQLKALLANK